MKQPVFFIFNLPKKGLFFYGYEINICYFCKKCKVRYLKLHNPSCRIRNKIL